MTDAVAGIAMLVFCLIVIVILLNILVLVHRQSKVVKELKNQIMLRDKVREKKER